MGMGMEMGMDQDGSLLNPPNPREEREKIVMELLGPTMSKSVTKGRITELNVNEKHEVAWKTLIALQFLLTIYRVTIDAFTLASAFPI